MAGLVPGQINKLLEYALGGLSGLCGHTPIKITNYVFNTRKLQKRELQVPRNYDH